MPVGDYCEQPARTIGPEDTVREAARRMDEENIGSLVLVIDNQPHGLITDRDLVLEVFCNNLDASSVKVGELRRGLVVTVREDAPLAEAAHLMAQHAVRRLPVVDDKGHVVGLIAADDIVRLVVGELSGLAAAVQVQSTWNPEPEEGSA
jgi:CBS domain-containing protein